MHRVEFSQHSVWRAARRNLTREAVRYVMTYGQRFRRAGALIYYLRKRDVPDWDCTEDQWMRLVGTAVILTKDGRTVITVWRNRRNGLKRIRRKPVNGCEADKRMEEFERWLA